MMAQPLAKITFPKKSPYRPETAEELLAAHDGFMTASSPAPDWLGYLRRKAAARLAEEGIPSPKLERWKYTNLPVAVKGLNGEFKTAGLRFDDLAGVVGTLVEHLEDNPEWLKGILAVPPVQEDKYADWALWHFSNAFLRDGLVVDVPAGKIVDKPVEIFMAGPDSGFAVPRTVIRLGQGAELTIIERHQGGHSWNNSLAQIIVSNGAHLRHYRIQDYSTEAVYTQNTHVQIERDATYEAFTLTIGACLSRNQIHADMQGQNGTCNLYGINMLRGRQLGDTTITIDHQAPHCNSSQFYRSVLDERGHGVFQGKVHVHQPAQKTDGYQLSNALLLSEGAEMDTKPELEIYADDVKCSHGATTGQIDRESLFYLRSRGLNEAEAQALLIQAFVAEVADKLVDNSLNDELEQRVAAWLAVK